MAARRKEIARDLLAALRGDDGSTEEAERRPRDRRFARDGEDTQFTREPEPGRRRRFAREGRSPGLALEEPASDPDPFDPDGEDEPPFDPNPVGAGSEAAPSVFQDVRARARELMQGFRDGTQRAGDGIRALRRDGDGAPTLPRHERGSTGPPWRRTPSLPPPPGPRPPRPDGRPRLKKLRIALVVLGLGLLAMVSWFFGIMMSVAQDLPALENREQFKNARNSIVTDRDGDRLATLTSNDRRIILTSPEISQTVKQAVVAIEDERFYEHGGIDFQGIGRAIVQDVLQQQAVQGASTITQQFVKNALRAQASRTVFQKLRESALAYHLERRWSKDKILTEYLNSIYLGEGAYGIESAAQTYFGWNHPGCGQEGNRCAAQLLPEEAALLAGMISSPSAYSPRNDPEAATERRNLVLEKMVEQGVLTAGAAEESAKTDVPDPSDIDPPDEDSLSPYFTTWLRQQVVDRYGAGEAFGGGLHITSTIDLEYQQAVEEVAYTTLAGIEPTAAIAVIDNRTGGVLAMVGGSDFEKEPFNLATNGHRQPGSSIKPFILARALEEGHTPTEVFASQEKEFQFDPPGPVKNALFEVKNYEDQYLGSASIATATQYSDNSVFAELGLEVGTQDVANTAEKMGIETDVSTNPAMLLGGLETGVSPLEMAYAFSTLGRSGQRIGGTMDSVPGNELGPTAIMKVTDADGDTVQDKTGASGENDVQTEQVIDATAADTAVGLLEAVVSSGTGESAATGDFAWGKTGTTDDNGDAWFVGGTEDITAAVWVGHADSYTPMKTEYAGGPVDGGTYPALIWHDVVTAYETIIGSAKEEDQAKASESSTETYTTPTEPAAPTEPVAPTEPAPTEPIEPIEPEPVAPEPTAPEPSAPAPPTGGGTTGGGTGATGASRG
jgi:penicillin-binding protein 1A